MATYFILRVPGVVPPQISRILGKDLLKRAKDTAPEAQLQVTSGPDLDARWSEENKRNLEALIHEVAVIDGMMSAEEKNELERAIERGDYDQYL